MSFVIKTVSIFVFLLNGIEKNENENMSHQKFTNKSFKMLEYKYDSQNEKMRFKKLHKNRSFNKQEE
jgi:hypothetical protein